MSIWTKWNRFILFFLFIFLLGACSNDKAGDEEDGKTINIDEPLMISAASSLTDALLEIKDLFETEYPIEITYNFSGSGKLAQQIEQGAPVDVYISANENWLQLLIEHDFIVEDSITHVTGNSLVLIGQKTSKLTYDDLNEIDPNEIEQIALGHPDSVPAGAYTKQALQAIGKWESLEDKFVYAQDVRQVLAYVETGNADLGFVYASDAIFSEHINVLTIVDTSLHDTITYPAGIVTHAKHRAAAEKFLEFIMTEEAQSVFTKYGFTNEH